MAALESANIGINVTQTKFKFRNWRKAVGLVASGVSIGTISSFLSDTARSVVCARSHCRRLSHPFTLSTLSHARQTWTQVETHDPTTVRFTLFEPTHLFGR